MTKMLGNGQWVQQVIGGCTIRLTALDHELENRLLVYRGKADAIIPKLAAKVNARGVY